MPANEEQPASDAMPLGTGAQEPDRVLDLLKGGSPGRQQGPSRYRRSRRHNCAVPVRISIESVARPDRVVPIRDAVTVDVSAGGLSFVSSMLLTPGTRLRVQFADSDETSALQGVVRHCASTQPGRFMCGVELVKPEPG